jgi:predicted secreted acid phosphatase
LEHIKVYKKELTSQLKEHKHSVEIVAKDLELISQHQRELKKLQTKIASIKSETSRLEEITNPKKNRLEELNKQYEILIPMERNLHELETLARQKQGEKEDFYGRIQSEYGGKFVAFTLYISFEN